MKLRIITQVATFLCLITVGITECTLSDTLKKTACVAAKKGIPNFGAAIVAAPILVFAQKYLGTTTVNSWNDYDKKNPYERIKRPQPVDTKQS